MVLKDGAKMSKSKGNVVDPQQLIERYGADTVRLFIIFATSPELSLEWSDAGVEGAHRFLKRVWALVYQQCNAGTSSSAPLAGGGQNTRLQMHQILQKANHDMEKQQFNTVVSAAMKLMNLLQEIEPKDTALMTEGISILLRLLAPITPHFCAELWATLGYSDILTASWPVVDVEALKTDNVTLVVQVNGKLRANITVPIGHTPDEIEAMAKVHPKVQPHIEHKTIRKIIVVPGKLVNIVVG
jgi:leucyl-tRNA synthetase